MRRIDRRLFWLGGGLLLAGLLIAGWLVFRPAAVLPSKGRDISGQLAGGDFSLTGHHGRAVSLSDFRGKVVVLFFGYTHCPDVCPTAMGTLSQAMRLLDKRSDEVQVLFVAVDPADTAAQLAGYVPFFDPRFLGLTGTPEQIAAVTKSWRAGWRRVEQPGGGYAIDHFAGMYLLDRQGKPRILSGSGYGAPAIAADIRLLLDR